MTDRLDENGRLLVSEHANLNGGYTEAPDDQRHLRGVMDHIHKFWRTAKSPGGRSPVQSLSRLASPEQAPLLRPGSTNSNIETTGVQDLKNRRVHLGNKSHAKQQQSEPNSSILNYILLATLSAILLTIAPLLTNLFYAGLSKNQYCVNSIYFATFDLSFAGSNSSFDTCQNTLAITSMYAAALTYCRSEDISPGFDVLRDSCRERGSDLLDLVPIAAGLSGEGLIEGLRVVELGDLPLGDELKEFVLIGREFYGEVFRTMSTWYFEKRTHHTYGFVLTAFWIEVIVLGIVGNVWSSRSCSRKVGTIHDVEGSVGANRRSSRVMAPLYWLVHYVRTYIMIPAAIGTHHQRLYHWCTIPSRFDGAIIVSFWILSIVLSCISYRIFPENHFWPQLDQQLWRYISDRTGIMSYATLPLIWLFATRNNGFLWATGWSYRTFNLFHRHVARVGTLLAIVHSVGYTYLYLVSSGLEDYKRAMGERWLILGTAAVVAMSFLWISSHAWIRMKFYESFLMLHIALSIITLVGLFIHTGGLGGEYAVYLWSTLAIWCSDRMLRLCRILHCNFRVKFGRDMISITHSTATYSERSDVIRLEVCPAVLEMTPLPGQFYHLYQPTTWTGYENHPFTLGAWTPGSSATSEQDLQSEDESKGFKTYDSSDFESSSSSSSTKSPFLHHTSSSRDQSTPSLVFWIRPYDGWTRKLRDQCLASAPHTCHPTLLLEGPYGHTASLNTYDTILLIAGGTGIASAVPYIIDHISRCESSNTNTTSVRLIWTARQKSFIEEICENELAHALIRDDFAAEFYTTRPPTNDHISTLYDNCASLPHEIAAEVELPELEIRHERPDIRNAILDTAREGEEEGASTAVLVCGPAGMADAARGAVCEGMREGCRGIGYFEEAFGW